MGLELLLRHRSRRLFEPPSVFDVIVEATFDVLTDFYFVLAVVRVDVPRRETIPADPLVSPEDALHARHVVLYVVVLQGGAGDAARPPLPGRRAPEVLVDLEQAVVAAVLVHGGSVEPWFPIGDAHPGRYLWLGELVPREQFTCQLAFLVDLSVGVGRGGQGEDEAEAVPSVMRWHDWVMLNWATNSSDADIFSPLWVEATTAAAFLFCDSFDDVFGHTN